MKIIKQKITSYTNLNPEVRSLIPLTYFTLVISKIIVKTIKHEKIIAILIEKAKSNEKGTSTQLCNIKKAISIVSKYTFYNSNSNCYAQSIATSLLLSKYNLLHIYYIGACNEDNPLQFHAWVTDYNKEFIIAGGEDSLKHSIIQEIEL